MVSVKATDNLFFPVVRAALLHNQINRFGLTPFIQDSLFGQKNVGGGYANRSFFARILVNKQEFSVEVKNKTAAVVERSFEHGVAACLQARIQITGYFCE